VLASLIQLHSPLPHAGRAAFPTRQGKETYLPSGRAHTLGGFYPCSKWLEHSHLMHLPRSWVAVAGLVDGTYAVHP